MKKSYETPSIEVVKFQYRDQVVVASGGTSCHQYWDGFGSHTNNDCHITETVADSGIQ